MLADELTRTNSVDTETFRLRRFVERLIAEDEVEIHDQAVPLIELGSHLDGNAKAVLFRQAGPERTEVVGNVLGSRERIAHAFDAAPRDLAAEVMKRLDSPQPVIEIPSSEAPVHQIIQTGDDADLTSLPSHVQHGFDGGPYISSGIDFTVDAETGWTNVGSRRLMLRSRKEAGIDLVAPSDLRAHYLKQSARGERVPIALTLGCHPADFIAASLRLPVDEITLLGTLRGVPLAVVKCVTNDIRVPADAEIVIEGYLDERGHVEDEGPYGEFFGYYGQMKQNPVFHLTAITKRSDALFQTVTIGGRYLANTDTAQIGVLRTEATVWQALQTAIREPLAVCASAASNGSNNVRVAMRQRVPGEARNAIAAVFGSLVNVKHVFVVDEDIDVHSDAQMDWALGTRFQADRDLVIGSGYRVMPLDPSLEGRPTGAKAGFDLTLPFDRKDVLALTVPAAPNFNGPAHCRTTREALESGPLAFAQIMEAIGSDDGREVACELDQLRKAGLLKRMPQGEYALIKAGKT
jgi:2,5-furandicarboxylate decarboxylase 1